jgi:acyl-coenzyme A thioesterase PaaI-like protein
MTLACSENELPQLLNDVAFTRNFGFVLYEIADGQCSIDVAFQEVFERPGGVVSGQLFMAAADVAMWLAIKTRLGLADSSVTVEMKTNFLAGVKRAGFRCNARY